MAKIYPVNAVNQLLKSLLTMLCILSLTSVLPAFGADDDGTEGVLIKDPGSELWRNVRQRQFADSVTQIKSTDANVLINISGESWRQFRVNELIPKAGIAILIGIIGIALFRILRGQIKLEGGRSGIKILRFTLNQRVVHWSVAILFVILALTGLLLMFGRQVLIPAIGNEAFGNIAVVAKLLHDYLGPAFAVAMVFLFFLFVRDNVPAPKQDIAWLMQGGGLFGKKHVSSDRYNAGEKGWFWLAALVGGAVVVSGLVLDFPIFGQSRETMELFHMIHSIAAVILVVASFGHIYMGTVAMEGTFEVMQTGYCDANWAKEHHDLWYKKVKDSGIPEAESRTEQPANAKEATT